MTWKMIKNGIMIAVPVVIVVALFVMRETLTKAGSRQMSRMQDEKAAADMADSVRLLYDYSDGHSGGVRYTFLEFGAKGCLSCRKMEGVMEEVKTELAERVKVRFMNVSKEEAQEWIKFFGVSMIPTQIVLDRTGHEVFRHTGFISAEELSKVFK